MCVLYVVAVALVAPLHAQPPVRSSASAPSAQRTIAPTAAPRPRKAISSSPHSKRSFVAVAQADLLDSRRRLLRLRRLHQRPRADAPHPDVRRLQHRAHHRRRPSRADGRVRLLRHRRLRLALRPLQCAHAALLVLRPARPLASLPALLRLRAYGRSPSSRCSTASTGSPPCRRP